MAIKRITATELHRYLADHVLDSGKYFSPGRTVITKHGRDFAAIVPIKDYRLLESLDEHYSEALQAMGELEKQQTIKVSRLLKRRAKKRTALMK